MLLSSDHGVLRDAARDTFEAFLTNFLGDGESFLDGEGDRCELGVLAALMGELLGVVVAGVGPGLLLDIDCWEMDISFALDVVGLVRWTRGEVE